MSREELFVRIATADAKTIARISAALEDRPQAQAENVKLYTITQAAREGGFSRTTANRMLKAGTLRTVELRPGCRRVPASELARIAKIGGAE